MKRWILAIILLSVACNSKRQALENTIASDFWESSQETIKIAFGSCNKHDEQNVFWDDILAYQPDIWIWGGDNVYADTDEIKKLRKIYKAQNAVPNYAKMKEKIPITGTWDDHDYGVNDGGVEFKSKVGSQEAFLDFMDVAENDKRRNRIGIYSSQEIGKGGALVKIINLDTRYFRSPLKKSKVKGLRYEADTLKSKTILGDVQWRWLENELNESNADFNLIVSSIQLLSNEHGFEKWSNFPHEVHKMKDIIKKSGAKGVIVLSGDRHISEFSRTDIEGLEYPLIDFTSSGLTHSYSEFSGEPNPFRVGKVVATTSYGIVEIDINSRQVLFRIMGDNAKIIQELKQTY